MIAYSRPFLPLFLHVLGSMTLVGAVLATAILALGRKRNAFPAVAIVALPAWAVTLVAGHWLESKEGLNHDSPGWLKLGMVILEPGVLILAAIVGVAFWWKRSSKPLAGRILLALSAVYLVLLAVAWLAMSGKWG